MNELEIHEISSNIHYKKIKFVKQLHLIAKYIYGISWIIIINV